MTPRNTRLNPSNRPKSQTSNKFLPSEVSLPSALALTENYEEEFPYVDLQDMVNFCENLRAASSNTYRTPPRHNPPRCCDVPALQSPKNAVAPTQTLIATSNPTSDYADNIQRVKTALADQQTSMAIRKELENNKINQNSDDKTNLATCQTSIIPTSIQNGTSGGMNARTCSQNSIMNSSPPQPQLYLNTTTVQGLMLQTCQNYVNSKNNLKSGNCVLSNLGSPNSSNQTQLSGFAKNVLGSPSGSGSPTCSHQVPGNSGQCHFGSTTTCNQSQCVHKKKEGKTVGCCAKTSSNHTNQVGVSSGKGEELRFIDEEVTRVDNDFVGQLRGVHRTPTVVSIGPLCPALDPIVRSCSVGYLDLVDAQMVPCDVALKMLRKEAPNKRLVLVSRKTKKRRKNKGNHETSGCSPQCAKPRLRTCGKSRSLDSSDMFPSTEQISLAPQLEEHVEEAVGVETAEGNEESIKGPVVENETIGNKGDQEDQEIINNVESEKRTELRKEPSDSPVR